MWDEFIVGFCKVEFLCYQGELNWLGWGIMGVVGLIVLYFILQFAYGFLMGLDESRSR